MASATVTVCHQHTILTRRSKTCSAMIEQKMPFRIRESAKRAKKAQNSREKWTLPTNSPLSDLRFVDSSTFWNSQSLAAEKAVLETKKLFWKRKRRHMIWLTTKAVTASLFSLKIRTQRLFQSKLQRCFLRHDANTFLQSHWRPILTPQFHRFRYLLSAKRTSHLVYHPRLFHPVYHPRPFPPGSHLLCLA